MSDEKRCTIWVDWSEGSKQVAQVRGAGGTLLGALREAEGRLGVRLGEVGMAADPQAAVDSGNEEREQR